MKIASLLAVLAAAASLVACGGEEPTSAPESQEARNRQAMLDFARCMRANGVDMPDPKFDGGRVAVRASKTDPATAEKAQKACAKYQAKVKAPELSDDQKAEMKQAALANARCMREHGIDFPDPVFDPNGGARVQIPRSLNPESAKFKAAQKACESTMPQGPSTSSVDEGGK